MNYNMSGMAAQGEILILLRILIAGNPANRQRSGKVGLYHTGLADSRGYARKMKKGKWVKNERSRPRMRAASLWLSDMGIRLRATAAESQHRTTEEEQKPARRLGNADNADVGANIASAIVVEDWNISCNRGVVRSVT